MNRIKNILIAEDELLIAKVLRLQLEKQGYTVENVADGAEVFQKVQAMKPDLIVLDVFLKNRSSGIEAGKAIRDAGIHTPIIFTTGNSYEATLQQANSILYSKVLIKPVEFEHLHTLIQQM